MFRINLEANYGAFSTVHQSCSTIAWLLLHDEKITRN